MCLLSDFSRFHPLRVLLENRSFCDFFLCVATQFAFAHSHLSSHLHTNRYFDLLPAFPLKRWNYWGSKKGVNGYSNQLPIPASPEYFLNLFLAWLCVCSGDPNRVSKIRLRYVRKRNLIANIKQAKRVCLSLMNFRCGGNVPWNCRDFMIRHPPNLPPWIHSTISQKQNRSSLCMAKELQNCADLVIMHETQEPFEKPKHLNESVASHTREDFCPRTLKSNVELRSSRHVRKTRPASYQFTFGSFRWKKYSRIYLFKKSSFNDSIPGKATEKFTKRKIHSKKTRWKSSGAANIGISGFFNLSWLI